MTKVIPIIPSYAPSLKESAFAVSSLDSGLAQMIFSPSRSAFRSCWRGSRRC